MLDISIERLILLNLRELISILLEGLGFVVGSENYNGVIVDVAYNFDKMDEGFNKVSIYIEQDNEAREVELGNPYMLTKTTEISVVVCSEEPNMAQEIASLIKNYFEINDLIEITNNGSEIGYSEVRVINVSQVSPNFPVSSKKEKFWWLVSLDVITTYSIGGD